MGRWGIGLIVMIAGAEASASVWQIEDLAVLPGAKTGLYLPLDQQGPGMAALMTLAERRGLSMAVGLAERKESLWGGGGYSRLVGGAIVDMSSAFTFTIGGIKPELGFLFHKDLGPGGAYGGALFVTMTTTRIEDIADLLLALPRAIIGEPKKDGEE